MIGQEVGNYILEAELGKGGMGEVYLGRHKSLGRKAAIKVMSPAFSNDPRLAERFSREARTQAQLRHPHIAQVLDHVEKDGRWFLIIEYMEGGTLEDVLAKSGGALPLPQALSWARQALLGLDYAHQNGVVHRDVKPANILINERGEAAVTDFGIAFEIGAQRLTSTGTSIGTPEYMSPEQIRGAADLDHRTDVYSMGVVLYELLAGRVPFEAASTFEVQRAQVSEPPPPLSQVNPAIPPALEGLVMRALAKDPAERYTSCGELAQAIEAYGRGEPTAVPVPPPPPRRRTVLESAEAPMFPAPAGARPSTRAPTVMADTGSRTSPLPPPLPAKKRTPSWWVAAAVVVALASGVFWVARPDKKIDTDGTSTAVAAARRAQDELDKARQAAAAAEAAAQQAETAAGQAQSEAKKAETSKQPDAAQSAAESARLAAATAQQAATTAAVEAGKADAAAVAAETAASEAANVEAADVKTGKQLGFSLVAVAYADEDSQAVEDARQYAADARAAAASAQRAADAARSSSERAAEASRRAELAARSVPTMPTPPVGQPPVVQPPPRLAPPPDQPVVAVMALGDPAMAGLLEMEMEERLLRAGFDVQDEHNSMRFNELLDSRGGAVTATEIMPILAQDGYHVLVVLRVEVGATRELNVRGQSMTLSSARLRMNAYLMPAKRSIGRGWTEQTEYTELSARAKAEQAFLGATADLADAIESDWKSFLAQFRR